MPMFTRVEGCKCAKGYGQVDFRFVRLAIYVDCFGLSDREVQWDVEDLLLY